MGVEAFGVSMHFVKPRVQGSIRELLESCAKIRMRDEERSADCAVAVGEYFDDLHLIEFQLLCDLATGTCKLSARISLCSYGTIDSIFVGLVSKILLASPAEVWLMTSALQQKPNYAPSEAGMLLTALPKEIEAMRAHWQALFGKKQGVVRPDDSFSFVGSVPTRSD